MPSKSKKHPKTPPSSSSSSSKFQSLSHPQILPALSPPQTLTNDELLNTLEEASSKFPSLLSKTSLISHVSGFDSSSQQKGARIWLSEASMLASYISPGSLVSVSLPSLDRIFSNGSPLSSLVVECSELFAVDWGGETDRVGNFFALATAFPSCKLKDGVRISSDLFYSLGCPTNGRAVFVQPIHSGSFGNFVHGNGSLHNSHLGHLSLTYCKELYIRPLHFRSWGSVEASTPSKSWSEKTSNRNENSEMSSPRTPASARSRLYPPSPSKLSLLSSEDYVTYLKDSRRFYFDSVEIQEVFGDDNARKLLQHAAGSWLCSRAFLCGNLVTVPVLSRLCLFEVVAMKVLSAYKTNGGSTDSFQLVNQNDRPYMINHATSVKICLETDLSLEVPGEIISKPGKLKPWDSNVIERDEVRKVGGLSKEYKLLCDIISSSMNNSLASLGLRTTKGVLLYGPPGTGKTSLAELCARDAGVNLFKVNGPEIISQYHGESEQALHEVFKSASNAAPSVIFIDELDAIAPARKEGGDELSHRMVTALQILMDGMSRTEGLLIIAATNRVECIEPALRRPGRLDREVEIGVPSPDQRLDILTTILCRMEHSLSLDEINQLAVATHGFVGADLAALSNEAAMVCLKRCIKSNKTTNASYAFGIASNGSEVISSLNNGQTLPSDALLDSPLWADSRLSVSTKSDSFPISEKPIVAHDTQDVTKCDEYSSVTPHHILRITFKDFERARMRIRPSAMREIVLEVPKVYWKDVGGQEEVKAQLMEAVLWPQKHQDAFSRIGTRPPTGLLMFGPPGCSKTLMARAVASEAGLNFLSVKGPELFRKWVGESEKAVRSLFAKARENAPSIIFFDEIDGLASTRGKGNDGVHVEDRVMSQLLVELDGLQERVNVTVIAATNRPDKIDPALLRPGRFDRLMYVGPPSEKDRVDVFRVHLRKMPCSSDFDLTALACLTEGYTGADISLVCREAAISALEENLDASEITMEHLEHAIFRVGPSEIQPYQQLCEKYERMVYTKTMSDDSGCHHHWPTVQSKTSSWNPGRWIHQLAYKFTAALSW